MTRKYDETHEIIFIIPINPPINNFNVICLDNVIKNDIGKNIRKKKNRNRKKK